MSDLPFTFQFKTNFDKKVVIISLSPGAVLEDWGSLSSDTRQRCGRGSGFPLFQQQGGLGADAPLC